MIHIQGDPCANMLYDENGDEIFDIEQAKKIAQERFCHWPWE